jgi:hypothetical protein
MVIPMHALCGGLLGIANRFVQRLGQVSRERIVQIADKAFCVILIQTQKGSSHDYELNFFHIVSDGPQLRNPSLGLRVGIESCSNGAHRRGFVASIGLCRILKVGIGSSWTIDANVSCKSNAETSMRLQHDSHYCYTQSCSNGFCFEKGIQFGLAFQRYRLKNIRHFGNAL